MGKIFILAVLMSFSFANADTKEMSVKDIEKHEVEEMSTKEFEKYLLSKKQSKKKQVQEVEKNKETSIVENKIKIIEIPKEQDIKVINKYKSKIEEIQFKSFDDVISYLKKDKNIFSLKFIKTKIKDLAIENPNIDIYFLDNTLRTIKDKKELIALAVELKKI